MRVTAIVERAVALAGGPRGGPANAVVDFSHHTVSLVAVVTDVIRHGRPVVGVAFDSIGRYAQSGILRDRTVARASGIAIAVADAGEHVRAFGAQMPDAKPSALLDHEAQRVSEIDVINGAVPRQGARVGVAAPVNAILTALIKSIERRWR
jgi:hypothetical protein